VARQIQMMFSLEFGECSLECACSSGERSYGRRAAVVLVLIGVLLYYHLCYYCDC
jgi:MYXO-CTERM domain-containing protein